MGRRAIHFCKKWLLPRVAATLVTSSVVCFCPTASGADAANTKRVVVLYPESDGRPGNLLVDRGIRAALQSYTAGPIEVYNEYLDLTRFSDERSHQQLAEFLRQKYAGRKIDVVIPGLVHALDFVLKYRSEVFSDVPIVFCAVEQREVESRTTAS